MFNDYKNETFVLRTPLVSIENLMHLLTNFSDEKLIEVFSEPTLKEGLFIASPVLYNEVFGAIDKNEKVKEKAILSLLKYYIRASARCTPYGLFGMVSTGTISEGDTAINIEKKPQPRVRLDMDYLCNIYNEVQANPKVYKELTYYLNTSLLKLGERWKYVEYKNIGAKRRYILTFVEGDSIMNAIFGMAEKGIKYKEIIEFIVKNGHDAVEAEEYTKELIDAQLLLSEISPSASGEEYQDVLFREVLKYKEYEDISKVKAVLKDTSTTVIQKFVEAKQLLESIFKTPVTDRSFFQVDTYREANQSNISVELIEEIKECADMFDVITRYDNSQNDLEKFKKEFYERYEDAEVPLLEVLDSEIGIDYKNPVSAVGTVSNYNMAWDKISKFYLDIYLKAQKQSLTTVEITKDDLIGIPKVNAPMPKALSLNGRVLVENNTIKFFWKILTSPGPLYFLGRFGFLDEKIEEICINAVSDEEKNEPDKVFAEVVHLPEDRVGNIALRPKYREYEIPYLTLSQLPIDKQLPVSDLMVSVRANKVVLRSKKLNKYVEPRMANAHNFKAFGLPVYHFLCDLQFQGEKPGMGWSWKFLKNEPFLPRVTYKNNILSLATWNIRTKELAALLKTKGKERYNGFTKLRKQLGIPKFAVYMAGDRELLLNLELPACIDILFSYCKGVEIVELNEFLFQPENSLVRDEDGKIYANEVMIPLVKEANSEMKPASRLVMPVGVNGVQRSFAPYSEWIFIKFFCGYKIGDKIVADILEPLCKKLVEEKIIDKWFFLRYADPKHHVRVRFHLNQEKNFTLLNKFIDSAFSDFVSNKLIWKVQLDTYNRELERYGADTIDIAEDFFYYNSRCVAELTKLFSSDQNDELRFIVGIYGVHCLYEAFGIDMQKRMHLVETSKRMFAFEFGVHNNKDLREQIKRDYREVNPKIDQLINNFPNGIPVLAEVKNAYDKQHEALLKLVDMLKKNKFSKNVYSLMPSFIHMFVNRFFYNSQRMNEMFIYQFLSKYYASVAARQKQAIS